MRFFAVLLLVLAAGFSWALWQGIDSVTGWLAETEAPPPVGLNLDEVEFTSADQDPVSLETTAEVEASTEPMPTGVPEPAGTTSPLQPAQNPVAETPTEAGTTVEVSTERPARNMARPEPSHNIAASEPVSPASTVRESASGVAAPDLAPPQPAGTPPVAEAAAPEPMRPNPVAAEPPASALTVLKPAPEVAPAELAPSTAPEPAVDLPVTEPVATDAPAEDAEPVPPDQTEAPQCNVQACAAAFRSFRASDCTYQPFEGPRQLCTQGAQATEPSGPDEPSQPVRAETPQCNIERCSAAFQSFRASDCTYQPFEGPRQICPY